MNDRRNNERRSYDRGGEDRRICERRDYNRRELIDKYFPFVKQIVYKTSRSLPPELDINDLINSGIIGLMLAAEKYEPSKGVQFKTFASHRIRGEIIETFRKSDVMTRRVRSLLNEFSSNKEKLDREKNTDNDVETVMEYMGLSDKDKNTLRQSVYIKNIQADELDTDYLYDNDFIDRLSEYLFIKGKLKKAIDKLSTREKKLIQQYYFDEKTFKEIGKDFKVTESRVSQIHQQILSKLREKLSYIREQERAA
jgi:RNA polymerase sigma factor for flagellar operon FliA